MLGNQAPSGLIMALFSHRQWSRVAAVIRLERITHSGWPTGCACPACQMHDVSRDTVEAIAGRMAEMFSADSKGFDRDKWLDECGLKERNPARLSRGLGEVSK